MKKAIIFILLFVPLYNYANTLDSIQISNFQREVETLKAEIDQLQKQNARIEKQLLELRSLRSSLNEQGKEISSLGTELSATNEHVAQQDANIDSVAANVTTADKKIDDKADSLSSSIKMRTICAVSGIIFAIVLLVVCFFVLRRRIIKGSSSIESIKQAQESIEAAQKTMQEESVKLDNKLAELLEKQMPVQPQQSGNSEPNHSLALKIADEIVRIETNLSRMDESVKGYKQLKKAVERIRTNFLANGYEIVDMLGKPYNEGMKLSADFVSDETLAEGEQKITGIIKPQINYNGKMIQAAQITVSQNI